MLIVHESRVEGADTAPVCGQRLGGLLGGGGGEALGELLDDLTAGRLGLVPQHGEGTAAGTVGRDLGRGQPSAVDEAEQVVLGADRGIGGGRLQDAGQNLAGGAIRLPGGWG